MKLLRCLAAASRVRTGTAVEQHHNADGSQSDAGTGNAAGQEMQTAQGMPPADDAMNGEADSPKIRRHRSTLKSSLGRNRMSKAKQMSGHKSKTVDELAAIGRPAVNAGVLQTDLDVDDTPIVTANDVKTNAVEKLCDKDFTISMVRQQYSVSQFQ